MKPILCLILLMGLSTMPAADAISADPCAELEAALGSSNANREQVANLLAQLMNYDGRVEMLPPEAQELKFTKTTGFLYVPTCRDGIEKMTRGHLFPIGMVVKVLGKAASETVCAGRVTPASPGSGL